MERSTGWCTGSVQFGVAAGRAKLVGHAAGAASGMRIAQHPRKMHLVERTTFEFPLILTSKKGRLRESW